MCEKNKKNAKKSPPSTKEARLSEALRANLRRRKAATKKMQNTNRPNSSSTTDE